MSFNQWKLLNLVKDVVTKIASDRFLPSPTELTKELLQTILKFSPLFEKDISKILQTSKNVGKSRSLTETKDFNILPELRNRIAIPHKTEQKICNLKWRDNKVSEVRIKIELKI